MQKKIDYTIKYFDTKEEAIRFMKSLPKSAEAEIQQSRMDESWGVGYSEKASNPKRSKNTFCADCGVEVKLDKMGNCPNCGKWLGGKENPRSGWKLNYDSKTRTHTFTKKDTAITVTHNDDGTSTIWKNGVLIQEGYDYITKLMEYGIPKKQLNVGE